MNEPRLWEVRVGLYCTDAEAAAIVEGIQRLLCPDPDHEPPCPVPWSTAKLPVEDGYEDLVTQARIEQRLSSPDSYR